MTLKGKKVTVVGLARSGAGAANLLDAMGAVVTVTDIKPASELSDAVRRLSPSVRLALGGHPEEIFMGADLIVVSPGVSLNIGPIGRARAEGIPVIGELELAYRTMEEARGKRQGAKGGDIPFLAVTGSNGKSTTTTLLDLMLRKAGLKTLLGGNIGNALTGEILKRAKNESDDDVSRFTISDSPDCVVVEVSSFQLEAIDEFRPRVASILNITADHMDRYHSFDDYAGAKARIFKNQGSGDFLVLNADDLETMGIYSKEVDSRSHFPEVFFFSRKKKVKGLYLEDGVVFSRVEGSERPLIRADEINIKGVHNLENAMAASAMALLAGCPAGAVIDSLREFGGLEHRLEFVRELNGVKYINDSKGTNVGAVVKSVESFREPLILIAGGRDKAGDFSELRDLVSGKVKALVLIGEAAVKIRKALGDVTDTVDAKDLREAVGISRRKAEAGDVVLLSPACASFDMFRDFEDRGRQFKEIVMGLNGNE